MPSSWLVELSSWFQNQEATGRLDVLMALLQMLHPLELRFILSCMEESVKRDSICFRDFECRYNKAENIGAEFADMMDPYCRSKLLVALSLLHTSNHATADVLYRTMMSLTTSYQKLSKTKEVLDQVLLMLKMAVYHPAFKFEQRAALSELADRILRFSKKRISCEVVDQSPTPSPPPPGNGSNQILVPGEDDSDMEDNPSTSTVKSSAVLVRTGKVTIDSYSQTDLHWGTLDIPNTPSLVRLLPSEEIPNKSTEFCPDAFQIPSTLSSTGHFINDIALVGYRKPDTGYVFKIKVLWSNNDHTLIEKKIPEWLEFHKQILNLWPSDAGIYTTNRKVPYFPNFSDNCLEDRAEFLSSIDSYIHDLKSSSTILHSICLANFLTTDSTSSSDQADDSYLVVSKCMAQDCSTKSVLHEMDGGEGDHAAETMESQTRDTSTLAPHHICFHSFPHMGVPCLLT